MGNELERFLNSLNTSDKHARTVFWLFWMVIFGYLVGKFVDYGHRAMLHPEYVVGPFLLLWFLSGTLIWRLQRKEKFLPIRNIAIGLIGFWAFLGLSAMILAIGAVIVGYLRSNPFPSLIFTILLTCSFFGGAFIGGCWIGFKTGKLFLLWCIVGVIVECLLLTPNPRLLAIKDILFLVALFAMSILGGYVGKEYSAKLSVTNKG